jgi:hypothetical protein
MTTSHSVKPPSRFDRTDEYTLVRLDLLNGERKSLKALVAKQREQNSAEAVWRGVVRCAECRLKVRRPGHSEGQDHMRRKGKS